MQQEHQAPEQAFVAYRYRAYDALFIMIHTATRWTWVHTQTDTKLPLADTNAISCLFKALWNGFVLDKWESSSTYDA